MLEFFEAQELTPSSLHQDPLTNQAQEPTANWSPAVNLDAFSIGDWIEEPSNFLPITLEDLQHLEGNNTGLISHILLSNVKN